MMKRGAHMKKILAKRQEQRVIYAREAQEDLIQHVESIHSITSSLVTVITASGENA